MNEVNKSRPLRVFLLSPLAGDVEANLAYARRCMLDSLRRGEAPIASHLLYPQVLDDLNPGDRLLGMAAGVAWLPVADLVAAYVDRGISPGMTEELKAARLAGVRVEERRIKE